MQLTHYTCVCSTTQLLVEAGFSDDLPELIEYVQGLGDNTTPTGTCQYIS